MGSRHRRSLNVLASVKQTVGTLNLLPTIRVLETIHFSIALDEVLKVNLIAVVAARTVVGALAKNDMPGHLEQCRKPIFGQLLTPVLFELREVLVDERI